MRTLFTTFTITFLSYMSIAMGAHKPISCQTNFGEKSFTIQGNTVAFHKKKDDGRSISSVISTQTKRIVKGFRKTLYQNGYKHLISIENLKSFDSNNDFLAVTSPQGHKMTFPINCKLME